MGYDVLRYGVPSPVKLTDCGLPPPLSPTDTVAVRVPAVLGVKITLILQAPPLGRLLPQVFVSLKSATLVPTIEMRVMLRADRRLLIKVMFLAALGLPTCWWPKFRLVGTSLT